MKKSETTNTFQQGMIMDLNPIVTPNNVLTSCLNGTIITYNGNENVLQNDMGNGRVETAYLPEGYIPMGTTQLGGIVYIVSYNPLNKKCQIGSFPSPERNFYLDSPEESQGISITEHEFIDVITNNNNIYNAGDKIITSSILKKILNDNLTIFPGDQFKITGNNINQKENDDYVVSDYGNIEEKIGINPKLIKFHIASIDDNDKILYLDDQLKWFPISDDENESQQNEDSSEKNESANESKDSFETSENTNESNKSETITDTEESETINKYYIQQTDYQYTESDIDVNDYRKIISSDYNVFQGNSSGKLAIIAELEVIDTFSATWDVDEDFNLKFLVNWTSNHSNINPDEFRVVLNDNKYTATNTSTSERKNDGYDGYITIHPQDIKINSFGDTINYNIIPKMKLGFLDSLKVSGSIDKTKIGTGKIELTQWKYYCENNLVTINWGLNTYLKPKTNLTQINLKFYNIKNIDLTELDNIKDLLNGALNFIPETPETSDSDKTSDFTYELKNLKSYSGYHQSIIEFNELEANNCYLTVIETIDNNNEKQYNYRILYTSKQFNSAYFNNQVSDYGTLVLEDYLKIKENTSISRSLNTNISELENTQLKYSSDGESKKSNITNEQSYDINLIYNLYPEFGQNLFNISNITSSIKNNTINGTLNDKTQVLFNNSGAISEDLNKPSYEVTLEQVESERNDNTYQFKFKLNSTFNNPLKVQYNPTMSDIRIEKCLKQLSINPEKYCIICYGDKSGGHYLDLTTSIDSDTGLVITKNHDIRIAYFKIHEGGDKGTLNCEFKNLRNIYDMITSYAQDYDITIVPIVLGDFHGSNQKFGLQYNNILYEKNHITGSIIPTYACKTLSGYNLYNASENITVQNDKIINVRDVEQTITKTFENYYKLVDGINGIIRQYEAKDIEYYPSYTENIEFKLSLSSYSINMYFKDGLKDLTGQKINNFKFGFNETEEENEEENDKKDSDIIDNIESSNKYNIYTKLESKETSTIMPEIEKLFTFYIPIEVNTDNLINSIFIPFPLIGEEIIDGNNKTYKIVNQNLIDLEVLYTKNSNTEMFNPVLAIQGVNSAISRSYKVINNILNIEASGIISDKLSAYFYCDDEGINIYLFK